MEKLLRPFLLALALSLPSLAAAAADSRSIGPVIVENEKAIPVRITASTPELQNLARKAFGVHGAYRVVESGARFDIAFAATGPGRVRVDVTRNPGSAPVASQEVAGASFLGSGADRNALLKAADIAVEKTNGAGLRGFFSSKLAFISDRTGKSEIYTSDLFFGDAKKWTGHNSDTLVPRWSPDGTKLLYTSFFTGGVPDIYRLDLVNQKSENLVRFEGTNIGARYSPNGQQIAMVLSGEGVPEVYVLNLQSQRLTRMTRSAGSKSSPNFSPDGSRIIFVSADPSPQLYMIANQTGSPMQRVATGSNYAAEPDWNRVHPNLIAFTLREGTRFQVAVLDLSTGTSRIVSKAAFDGLEPNWLPDGRHLVFTARDSRTSALFILDTETGKATPIGVNAPGTPSIGQVSQASVWAP